MIEGGEWEELRWKNISSFVGRVGRRKRKAPGEEGLIRKSQWRKTASIPRSGPLDCLPPPSTLLVRTSPRR